MPSYTAEVLVFYNAVAEPLEFVIPFAHPFDHQFPEFFRVCMGIGMVIDAEAD